MPGNWNRAEREVTPESAVISRRRWLKRIGYSTVGLAAGAGAWLWYHGTDRQVIDRGKYAGPGSDLYPFTINPKFSDAERALSPEAAIARYCNFYEFTSTKQVWRHVELFQPVPWSLEVTGLVAKPKTY